MPGRNADAKAPASTFFGQIGVVLNTRAPLWCRPKGVGLGRAHKLITLDDVSKRYPNGTDALRDVDLHIESGDFVFLVGSSGAGKSSLIRLLIREELPSSGRVWVDGQDVVRMRSSAVPKLRRRVGVVFQDFKLLPRKTVFENVAFALLVTGHSGEDAREETERALQLVGLSQRREHFPDQLSGGEQQRTAMARALVNRPKILIADEPTGNLDPVTSWEIIKLLVRVNELGTTLVMATHNAEIVNALRRRVIHLDRGMVVRDERQGLYAA